MNGLVLGFGAFGMITDNPSRRLALALDGRTAGALTLIGREMPVSYTRSLDTTARLVTQHDPSFVLGIGVAVDRPAAAFEQIGRRRGGDREDVDGHCCPNDQPDILHSTLPNPQWARHLGCETSDDAGTYVCNAWLHGALERFSERAVGFLHIPRRGLSADALIDAIAACPP